ncbi:hypothetical protein FSP39_018777 [Pinctada imbricata]|uniref:Uncharacterized protein n=1 Tax=Pinctada imbricata TaxID=66713 RepID=A0AA88XPU6_PINIB|nr:hypothetical protein FSP39_018777 [Pinctada imbricata]
MLMYKQISVTLLSMLYVQSGSIKCPDNVSDSCKCYSSQSKSPSISCDFNNQSVPQTLLTNAANESGTILDTFRASIGKDLDLPRHLFKGIVSIINLNLSYNALKDFPDSVFILSSITKLDLSHNNLTNLRAYPNMKLVVKSLNLSSNSIQFISRNFFRSFRNLQTLDLSKNNLRTLPDRVFSNLRRLSYLDISHNMIQSISKNNFMDASQYLQVLKLKGNNLSHIDSDLFPSFSILRYVDLSYNMKIGSMESVNFPPYLTQLDISMTGQSDLNYCNILTLNDLQTLVLQGNSIPCGCEIFWTKQHMDRNGKFLGNLEIANSTLTCIAKDGNETSILHDELTCSEKMKTDYLSACGKTASKARSRELMMNTDKCRGEIDFHSSYQSDTVSAVWSMGENCRHIYGYYLHIRDDDQKVVQDTVLLHPTTTSFTFTDPKLCCGEITICLKALLNNSFVFYQQCQTVYSFHAHMVIGILAGVIFLIPCAFILVYVAYHDYERNRKSEFSKAVQERIYGPSYLIQLVRFCQYRQTDGTQRQDADQTIVQCKTEDGGMIERFEVQEFRVTEGVSEEINDRSGVSNISFVMDSVKCRPS